LGLLYVDHSARWSSGSKTLTYTASASQLVDLSATPVEIRIRQWVRFIAKN
jgi:hypothetical protein